ncbi:MAG: M3 family metallopeptidase [Hyphomonadaceae bacterium]|nr:M3 family metallopeptidase [Hyphomonadaceae bacterium]
MTVKTWIAPSLTALAFALAACGSGAPETEETVTDPVEVAQTQASSLPEITVTSEELEGNPFLETWDTPYGVPPFAEIEDSHYMPALKQGILEAREEVAAIIANSEAPTFENTILALETAGPLVNKVAYTFSNITNTDTNDTLRALEGEVWPMLTRETDALYLNPVLFERVKTIHDQLGTLGLGEQEARLVELMYRDFERAGAALDADTKAQISDINAQLSALTTQFAQNLLASTKAFRLELSTPEDIAGLSQDFLAGIQVEGEDKWVVTLDRSVFETFMTQSENRELRGQVFDGYRLRASEGEYDNGPVLIEIAQLRAKRAELLGYESHAAYQLETRMARTPAGAEEFLLSVWRPGLERAKEERADMQAMVGDAFTISGEDWWHYAEKVRQARYAFDDNALKPYFELNAVKAGAFEMAQRLFNIELTEVEVDGWNPVVVSYDVTDLETGEHLGLFMTDMYARDSKRGGAWMSTYRGASDIDGVSTRPIVTNNLNLTQPPAGQPTLMRFDEVETLFHEFGHGLHGLLTQIDYERFSGVDGPRDYTEFPAQILEHWASQPQMLEIYATHYETGEVIPTELIDRMNQASTFNQGFKTTEFIGASLLDLAWHNLSYEEAMAITDARAFEQETLQAYGLIDEIEPRYRSNYFSHIFAGGYSAGYYAYLWSEILDADGFYAFKEAGDIFDPETAARLKQWVYESGGLLPADELYRNFRGSDPSIDPLLEIRGFKELESEG